MPWVTSVPWDDDVIDRGTLRNGRRPLSVDVGLAFVAVHAGIRAVIDDVEVLRPSGRCGIAERQIEELAEVDEIGGIDVGLADDGDRLTGAVNWSRCVPEWKNVVDGGEVVRRNAVRDVATLVDRECGLGSETESGRAAVWRGLWRRLGGG